MAPQTAMNTSRSINLPALIGKAILPGMFFPLVLLQSQDADKGTQTPPSARPGLQTLICISAKGRQLPAPLRFLSNVWWHQHLAEAEISARSKQVLGCCRCCTSGDDLFCHHHATRAGSRGGDEHVQTCHRGRRKRTEERESEQWDTSKDLTDVFFRNLLTASTHHQPRLLDHAPDSAGYTPAKLHFLDLIPRVYNQGRI